MTDRSARAQSDPLWGNLARESGLEELGFCDCRASSHLDLGIANHGLGPKGDDASPGSPP